MKYTIGKAVLPFAMIAGLGMSQAQAADLGGDCCADLEERIAELEATTVRKGNRKVSVKLSGQVNVGVLYWDDGLDNDIVVVDNTSSSTRFRMTGAAKFAPGWSAGFNIEIQIAGGGISRSTNTDQFDDDVGGNGDGTLTVRQAHWWIKSAQLGKFTIGQASPATDDITLIELGGTGVVSEDSALYGGGLVITTGNTDAVAGDTTLGTIFTAVDSTSRSNIVRYDTPTLMGFTVSTAWGENDIWDVALRYAGEFNGLRIAGGIGYFDTTDDSTGSVPTGNVANDLADSRIMGSLSFWHVPTGIFLTGFYNDGDDGAQADQDTLRWGGRTGYRGKLTPLGDTSLFVGYQIAEYDNLAVTVGPFNQTAPGNQEATQWEVGVVQRIDAAAMELFLTYKHIEYDLRDGNANIPTNDQQFVFAGGRIKF